MGKVVVSAKTYDEAVTKALIELSTTSEHVEFNVLEKGSNGFLGIGAKATQPEWGAMISEGRLYLTNAPWVSFFPALFVVFTVFIFNILGRMLQGGRR